MGGTTQADQLQGMAVTLDHQSLTTMEDQQCRGPLNKAGLTLARLWYLLNSSIECITCGVGWVVLQHAVHWVYRLWGFPEGADQGQQLPVFGLMPLGISYTTICRWLILVLVLKVPKKGQTMNQGQLLLVTGLWPLSKR